MSEPSGPSPWSGSIETRLTLPLGLTCLAPLKGQSDAPCDPTPSRGEVVLPADGERSLGRAS